MKCNHKWGLHASFCTTILQICFLAICSIYNEFYKDYEMNEIGFILEICLQHKKCRGDPVFYFIVVENLLLKYLEQMTSSTHIEGMSPLIPIDTIAVIDK